MNIIKEKIVYDFNAVIHIKGIQCPLCQTTIPKVHVTAEKVKILNAKINYDIEDTEIQKGQINFEKANLVFYPPFSYGFSCPSCNVNVLIEKK